FVETGDGLVLILPDEDKRARFRAGFDPSQPRDEHGRWTEGGSDGEGRAEALHTALVAQLTKEQKDASYGGHQESGGDHGHGSVHLTADHLPHQQAADILKNVGFKATDHNKPTATYEWTHLSHPHAEATIGTTANPGEPPQSVIHVNLK